MRVLICIDDTDDKESKPTGRLLQEISAYLEAAGWARCLPITRHQLFVHPDIPYTSHNSAMCMAADVEGGRVREIVEYVSAFLARESAPGADPGFCLVELPLGDEGGTKLVDYGRRAKRQVLSKKDAYALAAEIGVHLSEHGGTGQGVIGALAGAGLRLGGNDGRFKGKHLVKSVDGWASVADIYEQTGVDEVRGVDGPPLERHERVLLGKKIKSVLLEGRRVLLVTPVEDGPAGVDWGTCPQEVWRGH